MKDSMKIAIVSPSGPSTNPERIEQFERGLQTLRELGFECVVAPNAKKALSYVSSTVADRVSDLHTMYRDDSISVIVTANGGRNVNQLLDALDWKLIAAHPKPLVGFSDISILLNAIYAKTKLPQLHGPMVTWGFAENNAQTNESFGLALAEKEQHFNLDSFGKFIKGDEMSGTLVGGNLVSLGNLLGTQYQPDWQNKILFWEETNESIDSLDRELTHFKNAGIWSKISGMIIGHIDTVSAMPMIGDHFFEYDFPILKTYLFGHNIEPFITFPIGGSLDIHNNQIVVSSVT
jgi:muramoyltetrapeptide carboxypeptidase